MTGRRARAWAVGAARTVTVAGLLVMVEVGLRTVGFARLARVLHIRLGTANVAPAARDVQLPAWAGGRVRAAQRAVRRWPFGGPCLRESLLVCVLLRRYRPLLCIGVERGATDLLGAHAWVEIDGASYDPEVGRFHQLRASG